jgi:hypothetical protein
MYLCLPHLLEAHKGEMCKEQLVSMPVFRQGPLFGGWGMGVGCAPC